MADELATRQGLSVDPGSATTHVGNYKCSVRSGECERDGGRIRTNTREIRASSSKAKNALLMTWLSVGTFSSPKEKIEETVTHYPEEGRRRQCPLKQWFSYFSMYTDHLSLL